MYYISELHLCKKDGKKVSYNEAITAAAQLAYYQEKVSEYRLIEPPAKAILGVAYDGINTNWPYVIEQMNLMKDMFAKNVSFGSLASSSVFDFEHNAFSDYAYRFADAFSACSNNVLDRATGYFTIDVLNIRTTDCAALLERLKECLREGDKLDNWCHFRALLSKLDDLQIRSYVDTVIANNTEPKHIANAFKKQFYYQWIDCILAETPVLSTSNRISQDKTIRTFCEKDTEQFEINKARIRAFLSKQRPPVDMIPAGSPLSMVLQQGARVRNQKSIRALLAEAGDVILQHVKPCFMMSPLSVSTFLAPGAIQFDTVIFDEASQIFPQDAIGAIYRGKQLIVVGDSKQMPPSNFFAATNLSVDGDDFESILDLCSTTMRQLRLRWHYRSRYEQLITFSNKNFYDSELITFPSSKTNAPGIGVDYYHVDGEFDHKTHTNRKEAEFIVDLIYQNIEKYPERSLGVVAFSADQQNLIDKLLAKRRQNTPEKEYFFRNEGNEPFFVKNLETVQGDERDTIIFSVAYGFDNQGRFMHNFGPLSRTGGERRLNVAVTRAKHNVQLVASIHHTDIDLNRVSQDGARLLREYLDFAENGTIALERSMSVNPFEQFDSDFELEVCEFLRSKGFFVDTQVGCSGFKIDLGLKIPDSSDYVLAIECDGATYHSSKNARDRDRLRQEILERMGWKFYRIWSTDWFRNKVVEKERLLDAANAAINSPKKVETPKSSQPQVETFEEEAADQGFAFPTYEAANIRNLIPQHRYNFKKMIRSILEIEAPISEELLLKRVVGYFGREKVTNVVLREYEHAMEGFERYNIVRKNGFLYLKDGKPIRFRIPGDAINRDMSKHIAPEELADGLLEILKQCSTADKNGLYRSLAKQYNITRVSSTLVETLDSALALLGEEVCVTGNQVSLNNLT